MSSRSGSKISLEATHMPRADVSYNTTSSSYTYICVCVCIRELTVKQMLIVACFVWICILVCHAEGRT
jgi:hypothetical protein